MKTQPKTFRKKSVQVKAMRFDGSMANTEAIEKFIGKKFAGAVLDGRRSYIHIETLEGRMTAKYGDYIIKGVAGEFYSCRGTIFKKTYGTAK